jgi:hypothetical protein
VDLHGRGRRRGPGAGVAPRDRFCLLCRAGEGEGQATEKEPARSPPGLQTAGAGASVNGGRPGPALRGSGLAPVETVGGRKDSEPFRRAAARNSGNVAPGRARQRVPRLHGQAAGTGVVEPESIPVRQTFHGQRFRRVSARATPARKSEVTGRLAGAAGVSRDGSEVACASATPSDSRATRRRGR